MPDRVIEMLRQLEHLLTQVVENDEQPISRLSLVTPAAQTILPNPTQAQRTDWEGAVHDLFARQAARVPERIAVSRSTRIVDLPELNEQSNRLANYLRAHGIDHEDVVAISRTPQFITRVGAARRDESRGGVRDLDQHTQRRLIEYLELAEPAGWIQLEAAGPLDDSLAQFVSTLSCRAKLSLSPRYNVQSRLLIIPRHHPARSSARMIWLTSHSLPALPANQSRPGRAWTTDPLSPVVSTHVGFNDNDRHSMLSGLSHDPLHRDVFTTLMTSGCGIPEQELIETQGRLAGMDEGTAHHHLQPDTGDGPTARRDRTGRGKLHA